MWPADTGEAPPHDLLARKNCSDCTEVKKRQRLRQPKNLWPSTCSTSWET